MHIFILSKLLVLYFLYHAAPSRCIRLPSARPATPRKATGKWRESVIDEYWLMHYQMHTKPRLYFTRNAATMQALVLLNFERHMSAAFHAKKLYHFQKIPSTLYSRHSLSAKELLYISLIYSILRILAAFYLILRLYARHYVAGQCRRQILALIFWWYFLLIIFYTRPLLNK